MSSWNKNEGTLTQIEFRVSLRNSARYQHNRGRNSNRPTSPFTVLEPQNPWIDKFCFERQRRSTGFKALELWKGLSEGQQERTTNICKHKTNCFLCLSWNVVYIHNNYTTELLTIIESQNPGIEVSEQHKLRISLDFRPVERFGQVYA